MPRNGVRHVDQPGGRAFADENGLHGGDVLGHRELVRGFVEGLVNADEIALKRLAMSPQVSGQLIGQLLGELRIVVGYRDGARTDFRHVGIRKTENDAVDQQLVVGLDPDGKNIAVKTGLERGIHAAGLGLGTGAKQNRQCGNDGAIQCDEQEFVHNKFSSFKAIPVCSSGGLCVAARRPLDLADS